MAPGAWPEGLDQLVAGLFPGGSIASVEPLAPDAGGGATGKAVGYGRPLCVRLHDAGGVERALVFRTASSNEFGHDRRADRYEELLLAFDAFGAVPGHVAALDVGAILPSGRLLSLREAGEPYLVTGWAEGTPYAEDLRRVAARGEASPGDLARCRALADYLAGLHAARLDDPVAWRRALRDLVGHGSRRWSGPAWSGASGCAGASAACPAPTATSTPSTSSSAPGASSGSSTPAGAGRAIPPTTWPRWR